MQYCQHRAETRPVNADYEAMDRFVNWLRAEGQTGDKIPACMHVTNQLADYLEHIKRRRMGGGKQSRRKQSRRKQSRRKLSRGKQSRGKQSRGKQSRRKQSRRKQSRRKRAAESYTTLTMTLFARDANEAA